MKIVTEFPPNFEIIKLSLGNIEEHTPIFCYGDTIYNPFNIDVTPDLEMHEEVHSQQQGADPATWWHYYLQDRDFRLKQEIEAYGKQYALALKIAPRKLSDWVKEKCAQSLSSELYNLGITYHQAESLIRKQAKISTV